MNEWFQCKNCGQIIHKELITVNRCPFCGHDYLSEVVLKPRNVSPIYTYTPLEVETLPIQWKSELSYKYKATVTVGLN